MWKTRQRRRSTLVEELNLETDLIGQSTDPTSELMTREQLRTAIKLVRNLQLENWIRFPIFAKHNKEVIAARFMKIVEKMDEMIPAQPPIDYTTYQTFLKTDFMKFKSHYSGIEWNSLVARLTRIYIFYEHYKDIFTTARTLGTLSRLHLAWL